MFLSQIVFQGAAISPLALLLPAVCHLRENLGERLDRGALCHRLTPFEVVDRTPVLTVLAERGNGVVRAVVVGMNDRHHRESHLAAKLTPLDFLRKVAEQERRVRGRGANGLVLDGGDSADVHERQRQLTVAGDVASDDSPI